MKLYQNTRCNLQEKYLQTVGIIAKTIMFSVTCVSSFLYKNNVVYCVTEILCLYEHAIVFVWETQKKIDIHKFAALNIHYHQSKCDDDSDFSARERFHIPRSQDPCHEDQKVAHDFYDQSTPSVNHSIYDVIPWKRFLALITGLLCRNPPSTNHHPHPQPQPPPPTPNPHSTPTPTPPPPTHVHDYEIQMTFK